MHVVRKGRGKKEGGGHLENGDGERGALRDEEKGQRRLLTDLVICVPSRKLMTRSRLVAMYGLGTAPAHRHHHQHHHHDDHHHGRTPQHMRERRRACHLLSSIRAWPQEATQV